MGHRARWGELCERPIPPAPPEQTAFSPAGSGLGPPGLPRSCAEERIRRAPREVTGREPARFPPSPFSRRATPVASARGAPPRAKRARNHDIAASSFQGPPGATSWRGRLNEACAWLRPARWLERQRADGTQIRAQEKRRGEGGSLGQ